MLIKVFLRRLEEKINETVMPRMFMSDMQESYYNAWVKEMSKPEIHLHCIWHLWQAWKKRKPKRDKKSKQDLYDLTTEVNIHTFTEKLEEF